MGDAQLSFISESDYLAGEQLPGLRHEYVRGEVFAMTGASKAHETIAGNIFAVIRAHLREYLPVDQERQWAEIFWRGEEGWFHEIVLPGEILRLRSLDLRVNMDDIYETADVPRTAEKGDC